MYDFTMPNAHNLPLTFDTLEDIYSGKKCSLERAADYSDDSVTLEKCAEKQISYETMKDRGIVKNMNILLNNLVNNVKN